MEIIVSAPGKIILMGEHSVVYGKPAIAVAVGKRCKIKIKNQKSRFDRKARRAKIKNITIIDKNLNVTEKITIEEIEEFTNGVREKWEEYERTKNGEILKKICRKPLDLVKIAVGETYKNQKSKIKDQKQERKIKQFNDLFNFSLEVESEIPTGRGMGSSSALAAAVVGAMLLYIKNLRQRRISLGLKNSKFKNQRQARDKEDLNNFSNEDKKQIFKIALEVEKRIHGNPSGVDVMASIYGGFLSYRKDKKNKVYWENLNIPNENLNNFILLDSGRSEETTGEMVTEVRKRMTKKKRWGKELLLKMEKATEKFIKEIKNKSLKTDEQGQQNLRETIFTIEKCLEKMGTVSLRTKEKIRKLRELGIIMKISGAGGKKKNSGMIIGITENNKLLERTVKGLDMELVKVKLGAEGIKIEKNE